MKNLSAALGVIVPLLLITAGGIYVISNRTQTPSALATDLNSNQNLNAEPLDMGDNENSAVDSKQVEKATFGSGCFWCTEAVFQRLKGVSKVVSGYSGGQTENPTYAEVCSGTTGHAEVIQVTYDPDVISYDQLLEVFWKTHDPTTLNRQGNDIGTQYRSVVFYHNEQQRELASKYKEKFNEENVFERPVVTEISPFTKFYSAEDYHQNYFQLNPRQPYCQAIIRPKLEKFEKVFRDKLKSAQ